MGWVVYYHFARWVNAWKTSGQPRINGLNYRVENVIKQLIHASAVLHRDMKHLESLESTQDASSNSYPSFSCSPNFPRALYLDEAQLTHESIVR